MYQLGTCDERILNRTFAVLNTNSFKAKLSSTTPIKKMNSLTRLVEDFLTEILIDVQSYEKYRLWMMRVSLQKDEMVNHCRSTRA